MQFSEKCKTPTSQLYHEKYFNNNYFNWKPIYLCRSKVQSFTVQNTKQYTFASKMLFKLKKVESTLCLFCKTGSDICIYLLQVQKNMKTIKKNEKYEEFFSTGHSLPSISPQKIITGFLDDALEHNFFLNHNY